VKQRKHRFASAFLAFAILLCLGLVSFVPADAAGTGVSDALTPNTDWQQLGSGQSRWYAFQYAGDGSQVQVELQVVPQGSADFVVWTPEEIYHWGLGERVQPIGRGSVDADAGGALLWSGSFTTAGTYYVVVEVPAAPAGGTTETSYYLLDVSGTGVSFSVAAPSAAQDTTAAPVAVQSQPRSALASQLGGTLVFQTTYGGPLYTINADGSDLQRLTNGIDPIWSPDGTQIAFVRWEDPRGVWVVNADGSNAHRVFDWSEARYPSWSPDGQGIVFSRQESQSSGGHSGGFSGTSGDAVGSARRPPAGPPPGGSSGGGATLGIVNAGDGTFREPLPVSTTNLTPDWSPSGEQIVFAGNTGLTVQNVDGTESWQLTTDVYDTTPAWSPDGTKVAFVRRQHDHWEIYVIDLTTGQQTRLTDTPALDDVATSSVSPAWSPDGNYIAYLTNQTGEWEIWVMKANGSGAGPLFGSELDGLVLQYAFAGERAIDWTR
jgi:hypothetical protein